MRVATDVLHFFAKTSFSGQKILEIIMILSEFSSSEFGVFLLRFFFFSYGTEQLCHRAGACSKKKKKSRKKVHMN